MTTILSDQGMAMHMCDPIRTFSQGSHRLGPAPCRSRDGLEHEDERNQESAEPIRGKQRHTLIDLTGRTIMICPNCLTEMNDDTDGIHVKTHVHYQCDECGWSETR